MTTRTKAARLVDHGAVPVVEEVELAEPNVGEVLVDMCYGSLNPLDTYVIQGAVGGQAALPRTVGVEGVGLRDGRPVVVHGAGLGVIWDGVWAGKVVAPEDALVPVPEGVALEAAAAAAVVGTTAIRATGDVGRVSANDRVLVLGATGGVGQAIISLARSAGAQVWGQTASADKAKAITDLGADPVQAASPDELLQEADEIVPTVVFDALGGGYTVAAVELLTEHGRLVSYGASAGAESTLPIRTVYRKNLTIAGYGGMGESPDRLRGGTELALRALADGSMTIPVHEVRPLHEVGTALATLKSRGGAGKILLDLRG